MDPALEAKLKGAISEVEAQRIAQSRWWDRVPLEYAARLQLFQDRLVMDFSAFKAGMEALMQRPIGRDEFSDTQRLRGELMAFEDGIARARKNAAYSKAFADVAGILPSALPAPRKDGETA